MACPSARSEGAHANRLASNTQREMSARCQQSRACVTCRAEVVLPPYPVESEENAQLSLSARLAAAMAVADVAVHASCYCRLASADGAVAASASENPGGGVCCEEGTPPVDGKDACRL